MKQFSNQGWLWSEDRMDGKLVNLRRQHFRCHCADQKELSLPRLTRLASSGWLQNTLDFPCRFKNESSFCVLFNDVVLSTVARAACECHDSPASANSNSSKLPLVSCLLSELAAQFCHPTPHQLLTSSQPCQRLLLFEAQLNLFHQYCPVRLIDASSPNTSNLKTWFFLPGALADRISP